MLSTLALVIFPLLMVFAALSDLFTMRIANWLVIVIALAYFVLAVLAQMSWDQIWPNMAIAVAVLTIAFAFFAFGWIGGGDAKLIAATTLWMGLTLMLPYVIYSALLGGALTLVILWLRRFPLTPFIARHRWLEKLHDSKTGVPYGVALAIAALLVYPQTPIFQHFAALG